MTTKTLRKADRTMKRVRYIARVFITTLFIITGVWAIFCMFYTISALKGWTLTHSIEIVSPVKFVNPIVITELQEPRSLSDIQATQEAKLIPEDNKTAGESGQTKSEKDIVMEQKDGKLLWAMYQLETQRGKTDSCRNNNRGYGGWGVKDRGSIVCYETFEKAVARAQYWLSKNKQGSTLAQALCRWSGHGNVNDCMYYRNALATM